MAAKVPDSIEGYSIGAELRTSGVLTVRAGTSRLDLPVNAFLAEVAGLTGGFEADDFLAGVRRAAAVQHEALLPFVTGGRAGEYVFGIAKSVEGGSLAAAIGANGPFSEARTLALGMSIAGALSALERAGMRHGDLAPERILIVGLDSFVVEPPRIVPAPLVPRDPMWQSPEEARGGENGVQSDQFVLGLVLWFALTGRHPVVSATDARRVLRDWKTPDLTMPLRVASPETRAVIARLLAAEPANRFPSATDALRALQDSASSRPETAPIQLALPSAKSLVDAPKRPPGRLLVETRIGEALIELADDAIFVGAGAGKSVRVQPTAFPEAILRIERAPAADVVQQVTGDLTVNGKTTATQVLADGDRIVAPGLSARYEKTAKAAAKTPGTAAAPAPPPGNPLAGIVTAVAMLGTIAALGWGASRVMGASKEAQSARQLADRAEHLLEDDRKRFAPADATPVGPVTAAEKPELLAQTAYENAARVARARPSEARAKYYEVWQRFPETAYGLLARLDAVEIDRRIRPPADAALEELLRTVDLRQGELDDDTVSKLRTYIEDHGGTLAAARAHVALVKSQASQRGRYDADMASVRALIAKKDLAAARALLSKILDYVPPSLADEARAEIRAIDAASSGPPRDGPPAKPRGDEGGDPPPKDGKAGADEAAERNRRAEDLFRSGRKLMDGGKEVEALDVFLQFLRECKDTPNGTKYDDEVRGRISTLSTGTAGVVRLFRGKVERADKNGRWRITYDFEDAAQLEDFKDVLAFEQPPRASWKHESGAVRCTRGSGAFVLNAPFGADEISASAKISTDKPHDLGVMFMDPSEQRRFYLYTLGNTFFTLGLGPEAKPFLENAIVLFGPDMWAKTPKGQLGYVRKCGSDEPKVMPSEPTPVKCGKSGAEVWMKFEGGRSIRGSAYGDVKYDFPGVMPGFFVINSTGWFDDLVIEGTLDVNWVQKRWREIVDAL